MNILITGATGFIGQNLIRSLIPNNEVHLLLRPSSKIEYNCGVNILYFRDNNIEEMHEYLNNHNIEGIIHLASLFIPSHKKDDIKNLIESNIYLGTAILESSLNSTVKWFLNTGTFWQHYISDSEDFCPVNLYAATKQAFIDIAKYYTEISGIKFSTLKICDTYGPNDTRPKLFNLWKKISESGESLSMSLGEQVLNILYIEDVIAGFLKLINFLASDFKVEADYALYANQFYTLRELASIFEEMTQCSLNIRWGETEYRKREVMQPWLKGIKLPGWEAQVDIKEGITKFIQY